MAEGEMRFSLDIENFRGTLGRDNLFNLHHEFKIKKAPLSQSLLVWREESGNTWLLADFENKKIYDIDGSSFSKSVGLERRIRKHMVAS